MSNVTYLLGAGASYHALPLVKDMPERMREHLQLLNNLVIPQKDFNKNSWIRTSSELLKQYTTELNNYINILEKQASFDTYAKKLFIKGDLKALHKLKSHLAIFFIIEQSIKSVDYRYDSFWAAVLKNRAEDLPPNIKFLSWNYDFQLEKSYSSFNSNGSVDYARNYLGTKIKSRIPHNFRYSPPNHDFKYFKLNGTTTFRSEKANFGEYENFDHKSIEDLVLWTMEQYLYLDTTSSFWGDFTTNIHFAWENENNITSDFIKNVILTIQKTTSLIVIGYSFPYFNREIDKEILLSMKELDRIYVQDINPNPIITRLKTFKLDDTLGKKVEIIPWTDIDQFLIPDELD